MVEGDDIKKLLGQALQELRLKKNLSQEKMAELANLDRSYISELENGNKTASIVTLFKVSVALDAKPSDIVREIEGRVGKK